MNQQDPIFAEILLQADDGNSAAIRVGGDNAVTAAIYGLYIPAPATNVPDRPIRLVGPLQLSDLWAIGTENEILNILARLQ
jgi:hypothetical protein